MHMADALVAPATAAVMYAVSAVTAGTSVHKLRKDSAYEKLPTMAVMSALVFAGQMVNYTIPGTGSSGHMCGGMLLTAMLGPQAGFLSMIVILAIQCLFFADGGLLALGANVWNMAFYGCFVGYYLIYRPIMKSSLFASSGVNSANRLKLILASVVGCIVTLQLGAFSVVVETTASGITELPFGAFCAIMQPIHLAIGLIEGVITSAVLLFVYSTRPELIPEVNKAAEVKNKTSLRTTIIILAVLVALVGGGISLMASSNPDGLEWSMFGNEESGYSANMSLDEEEYGISSSAADKAGAIVDKTAFLPDYAFSSDPENAAGTTVSGLVGSAIVAALAVAVCLAGGFFRKKKAKQ